MTSFKALRLQNEVYKLQEELKLKQKQLEDENKCSKLNISRNEIVDIFEGVVPKYVAMKISSYHRHPIDEFIGEDKLKEKESKLLVAVIGSYHYHDHSTWHTLRHAAYSFEYRRRRERNVFETNRNLSARLRIFYPFTRKALNTHTKIYIFYIAEKKGIKLSMSWKKDKMIDEFFKRS